MNPKFVNGTAYQKLADLDPDDLCLKTEII